MVIKEVQVGEFGGHWSLAMKSAQLVWSQFCVARAVCAGLLEDVSTGQSKFINKELAVLLFRNTTSQMTSLKTSCLLVILNH